MNFLGKYKTNVSLGTMTAVDEVLYLVDVRNTEEQFCLDFYRMPGQRAATLLVPSKEPRVFL